MQNAFFLQQFNSILGIFPHDMSRAICCSIISVHDRRDAVAIAAAAMPLP